MALASLHASLDGENVNLGNDDIETQGARIEPTVDDVAVAECLQSTIVQQKSSCTARTTQVLDWAGTLP